MNNILSLWSIVDAIESMDPIGRPTGFLQDDTSESCLCLHLL